MLRNVGTTSSVWRARCARVSVGFTKTGDGEPAAVAGNANFLNHLDELMRRLGRFVQMCWNTPSKVVTCFKMSHFSNTLIQTTTSEGET